METEQNCNTCIFLNSPVCDVCNGWALWYDKNTVKPEFVQKLKSQRPPEDDNDRQGHPMFYQLLDEIADLHSRKNADYGDGNPFGNFLEAKAFGVTPFMGVLIRMSDKYTRIRTLARQADLTGKVKEESIIDTLKDLAVYALIAVVMLKEGEK